MSSSPIAHRQASYVPLAAVLLVLAVASGCQDPVDVDRTFDADERADGSSSRTVGIWYSTWYASEGKYIWKTGHGVGSDHQFVADVTGDGKADAVVFFDDGRWYVAEATNDGFNDYSPWGTGHGVGSDHQLVADVTGDGKADAVVFFGDGRWYVAASNGHGFDGYNQWGTGHGLGSNQQFLADVTGDGRADAIVFFGDGRWYVAASNGHGFDGYSQWGTGHGVGSDQQFVADVTGDGKADAVVFFGDGSWYAAASNGHGFDGYFSWGTGLGRDSDRQLVADVTGDGKANAVVFFDDGRWYAASSSAPVPWEPPTQPWKVRHGNGSQQQFLADVFGCGPDGLDDCGRADPIAYGAGAWRVLPSKSYYRQPNILNTWEGWGIDYIPRVGSEYRRYDSGEATVIDEHLSMMKDAGIDFLVMDQTNHIYVDNAYIYRRAKDVCRQIASRRAQDPSIPRHATAIGGIQWTHDPATIENEAREVWEQFVTSQDCGGQENYFMLDGKPLLVAYAEDDDRRRWADHPSADKAYADRFTIRWTKGSIDHHNASDEPRDDESSFFGWAVIDGSIPNQTSMVVMPGWDNHKGATPVPRGPVGQDYYTTRGWDVVTETVGGGDDCSIEHLVVINSFNEYAEETAVAPTATSHMDGGRRWPSNDYYWDITRDRVADYRCE